MQRLFHPRVFSHRSQLAKMPKNTAAPIRARLHLQRWLEKTREPQHGKVEFVKFFFFSIFNFTNGFLFPFCLSLSFFNPKR